MGTGKGPMDKAGRADALTVSHLFHNRQGSSEQKRRQHHQQSKSKKEQRTKGGRERGGRNVKAWGVLSTPTAPGPLKGQPALSLIHI